MRLFSSHSTIRRWVRAASVPVIALTALTLAACSPSSLVDVDTPNGVVDPASVTNPASAQQFYNFAVGYFSLSYGGNIPVYAGMIAASGIFTDELMVAITPPYASQFTGEYGIDGRWGSDPGRIGTETYNLLYSALHRARTLQQQARDALRLYAPAAPVAWQGQLMAQEGYTVLWLAEQFCSGVPLPSVPLQGTATLTRGFTTDELFERAIILFDSAMTVGADSATFVNLAKVGKGRALLGLGRFADAAAAVHDVPTSFVYQATYAAVKPISTDIPANGYLFGNVIGGAPQIVQSVDGEGGTGLTWSTDPRTGITTTPALSGAMHVVGKYSVTAGGVMDPTQQIYTNPIRVADGLEARLIEAEADLSAGGGNWLTMLNTLRSTCVGTAACAPVPGLTSASLPPLTDPGTPDARLDTLMKERAMWLYVTGHRQGDLRRLGHVYHRNPATLYPTGTYINAGFLSVTTPATTKVFPAPGNGLPYGSDVVFITPAAEKTNNPLYAGCYDTAL